MEKVPRYLRGEKKAKTEKKARKTIKKYNTGRNKGRAAETIKSAKNLVKSATPWGIVSLLSQGSFFSDWMYGLALFAAIFKDLLDFSIATGVMYGVVVVLTLLCSLFIGMMMLLGSFENGFGRAKQKMIRSWLILLGGTTIEMLFGIDLLPIETLTVFIVYLLLLSERKQSKQSRSQNERLQDGYADDYQDDYAQAA